MLSAATDDIPQRRWFNSLSVRVAIFLSLALLPLGLLAVLQTRDLTREIQSRAELSLLALTDHAASGERQTIERALGAAEALSAVLRMIRTSPDACTTYLSEYLNSSQRYSYVGFIPPDGLVRCASDTQFVDFSNDPLFKDLKERPQQFVAPLSNNEGAASTAVLVFNPVMEGDQLLGFTVVSVLPDLFRNERNTAENRRPLSLVTFNRQGRILTSESMHADSVSELPSTLPIAKIVGQSAGTFFDANRAGEQRVFVNTEIVPGIVYALGTWEVKGDPLLNLGFKAPTSLFPLLMWLASLAVAVFAVHRLVVRHLHQLSREMRRFAIDRNLPKQVFEKNRPIEMQELEKSFQSMAHALLNDEARMENALREKNVLLKEIHHRVKNNLQMISSIMNMNIRKAQSVETKATIRRLQTRVLGLATVHRNLYQTNDLTKTNAAALLREIFGQLMSGNNSNGNRIKVAMHLDDIVMFPDQAVPFSLLASEIATQAIHHAQAAEGNAPVVELSLEISQPGTVRMICRNSLVPGQPSDENVDDDGLGPQLVKAFVVQLAATITTERTDDAYTVTVTFPVQEMPLETRDY